MKMILAVGGCFAVLSLSLVAQGLTNAPTPARAPLTNAPAPNALTNAPAVDGDGATNEVTIEDLMKLPAFTNDTGILMVKVSDKLWVSAYETTQDEFKKIAGNNPSRFQGTRNPVENVSWNETMNFCARLNDAENEKKLLPEGFAYTLPTQAQWESLASGVDLKDAITSSGTSRSGTAAVGTLGATGPGLYDIRGNVCEWCLDPQDTPFRVARGGSWETWIEINLRPAFRWFEAPDMRRETIGFRVVLEPKG